MLKKVDNSTFLFEGHKLRFTGSESKPMFIASDVCKMIGLSNVTQTLQKLPEKWKGVHECNTTGGRQQMSVIGEPALYKLMMTSKHPVAERFQQWVCGDVLTSIYAKSKIDSEERSQSETKLGSDKTKKKIIRKQCSKCLEYTPLTNFYLRKDKLAKKIGDVYHSENDEEESDPEPDLDPTHYRSHCKTCCNSDMKELRKKIRQDENHNKHLCVLCDTFLPLDLFYSSTDDTLYDYCITCYKEKENLPDAIKQCTACKELLEPVDFHVHSTDSVRTVCKQCRNETIREKRATVEKTIVVCEFCEKEVLEKNLSIHHETKRCLQRQGKLKAPLRNKPQTLSVRARGVIQYDKNGKEIQHFVSLTDASEKTGILHTSISACCRGLYKTSGGFSWKYSDIKE